MGKKHNQRFRIKPKASKLNVQYEVLKPIDKPQIEGKGINFFNELEKLSKESIVKKTINSIGQFLENYLRRNE